MSFNVGDIIKISNTASQQCGSKGKIINIDKRRTYPVCIQLSNWEFVIYLKESDIESSF